MAKDNKIRMPSGIGGITTFYDEKSSTIQFAPVHVVILCIVVMIIILLLHLFGGFLIR